MPRTKKINRKKFQSNVSRSRNVNAHDRRSNRHDHRSIVAELESIGRMIIADVQDFNRQQISSNYDTSLFIAPRRSLKEIFDEFQTFDDYQRRECRSIGIGDDSKEKEERTTTMRQMSKNSDGLPTAIKKIRKEPAVPSATPVTRTICTRSFTSNALIKNNRTSESIVDPMEQRPTTMRRTSSNRSTFPVEMQSHPSSLSQSNGDDKNKIGSKVSRKKIQLSTSLSSNDVVPHRSKRSKICNEF